MFPDFLMTAVVPANREDSYVMNASFFHEKTKPFISVSLLNPAFRQNRAVHRDFTKSIGEILGIDCTFSCFIFEKFAYVSALKIQSRFDLRFQNES